MKTFMLINSLTADHVIANLALACILAVLFLGIPLLLTFTGGEDRRSI